MPPGVHAVLRPAHTHSGVAPGSEEQLRERLRLSVLNLAWSRTTTS